MSKKPSINALFLRLRRLSESKGYIVYNIYIRRAGVGIAYTKFNPVCPEPGEVTVFAYHKTLQAAIVNEIKAWKGHDCR